MVKSPFSSIGKPLPLIVAWIPPEGLLVLGVNEVAVRLIDVAEREESSANPIWETWTFGFSLPAGKATEESAFVGKLQVKLAIAPDRSVHWTPRRETVISDRANPILEGSVIDNVITLEASVADDVAGVAAELNVYEQSAHTAGIELTFKDKEGFSDSLYKKSIGIGLYKGLLEYYLLTLYSDIIVLSFPPDNPVVEIVIGDAAPAIPTYSRTIWISSWL